MDQRQYLTVDEVRRLKTVAGAEAIKDQAAGRVSGPRRWIVVDLALSTGLRVSELAALTWADWSPKRQILTVRRLKRRTGAKPETLTVPAALASHLEDWRRMVDCSEAAPIVPGRDGSPLNRSSWRRLWQRACKAADVPAIPIHGARHTLAHHTLAETGNLALVQRALGHSTPTITANMYGHVSAEQIGAALEQVQRSWRDA